MEHRWSLRAPIHKQVTLYRNQFPVAKCIAKDIGLGGLFLEAGPLAFGRHTPLDVEIQLDTQHGAKRFRLKACVIHRTKTGFGLMFMEPNGEVFRSIRKLLLTSVRQQSDRFDEELTGVAVGI